MSDQTHIDTPQRTAMPQPILAAAHRHSTAAAEAGARDDIHYMGSGPGSSEVVAAAAFGVRRADYAACALVTIVAVAADGLAPHNLRWSTPDEGKALRHAASQLEPAWTQDPCYLPLRPERLRDQIRDGVRDILTAAWDAAAAGALTVDTAGTDAAVASSAAEAFGAVDTLAAWRDCYQQMIGTAIERSAYWELAPERSILTPEVRKEAALTGAAAAASDGRNIATASLPRSSHGGLHL